MVTRVHRGNCPDRRLLLVSYHILRYLVQPSQDKAEVYGSGVCGWSRREVALKQRLWSWKYAYFSENQAELWPREALKVEVVPEEAVLKHLVHRSNTLVKSG